MNYTIVSSEDLNAEPDIDNISIQLIGLCIDEHIPFNYSVIEMSVNEEYVNGVRITFLKTSTVVYISPVGISITEQNRPVFWYTDEVKFKASDVGISVVMKDGQSRLIYVY